MIKIEIDQNKHPPTGFTIQDTSSRVEYVPDTTTAQKAKNVFISLSVNKNRNADNNERMYKNGDILEIMFKCFLMKLFIILWEKSLISIY